MFERFGYASDDADVRARTVYLVQIGYIAMQVQESAEARMSRVERYVEIFSGRSPTAERDGTLPGMPEVQAARARHGSLRPRHGLDQPPLNARRTPDLITYDEMIGRLSWPEAVEALRAGHLRPRAQVADMFLGPADATLFGRGAFIEGLGYGVKSVTVFDRNAAQGLPTVQGAMFVFEPRHGRLDAIIDSRLVTEFKTAADSVLGARFLARPDSAHLLVVGAGTVARSLIRAYRALFPQLERVSMWARRPEQSTALAREFDAEPSRSSPSPIWRRPRPGQTSSPAPPWPASRSCAARGSVPARMST